MQASIIALFNHTLQICVHYKKIFFETVKEREMAKDEDWCVVPSRPRSKGGEQFPSGSGPSCLWRKTDGTDGANNVFSKYTFKAVSTQEQKASTGAKVLDECFFFFQVSSSNSHSL